MYIICIYLACLGAPACLRLPAPACACLRLPAPACACLRLPGYNAPVEGILEGVPETRVPEHVVNSPCKFCQNSSLQLWVCDVFGIADFGMRLQVCLACLACPAYYHYYYHYHYYCYHYYDYYHYYYYCYYYYYYCCCCCFCYYSYYCYCQYYCYCHIVIIIIIIITCMICIISISLDKEIPTQFLNTYTKTEVDALLSITKLTGSDNLDISNNQSLVWPAWSAQLNGHLGLQAT